MLSSLRRRRRRRRVGFAASEVLEAEEVEEVEGEAGEAGTLGVTFQKYIIISIWPFAFSFLQKCSVGTNPSSTICFNFSAYILEGSMSSKNSQEVFNKWNPLSHCLMSAYFLALFVLPLLPLAWHWVEVFIFIKLSSVHSSGVVSFSSWISSRFTSWDPSHATPPLFGHIHNLFRDFLDRFCHKSCKVMCNMWTQFSRAGIYYFWLDGFHGFFCNNDGIQWCNPSRLSWSLSQVSLPQCWQSFPQGATCHEP